MEDSESEWKIQEYSSSSKEDDEDDNKPTVVRRILTNGYVIGKEFVITGIFISSAPLVVPPLVVVSAVGFVFTVPFGVLFASYACTNKIMSMLLPAPVPLPLRLEYYCSDEGEQEDYVRMECKLGLDDYGEEVEGYVIDKEDNELVEQLESGVDGYRQLNDYGPELVEGYVTDKDDNEVVEDVNEEVETEIVFELGDDDSRRAGGTSITNVDEREMEMEDEMLQRGVNGTKENEREEMEDVEQGVIEMRSSFDVVGDGDQGYEEDAGEYLEGDDGSLEVEEGRKGEERLVENWDDESESGTQEVNGDAILRDEGWVDNTIEDGCIVSESASDVVFGDVKDVGTTIPVTSESASDVVFGDVKDVGTTVMVTDGEIESEKLAEVGSKNVEQIGEIRHVVILSDVDVDEMEMEMEDDILQRENVTEEKEREQVEDVKGVEMRLSFDVAGDDDQGYEEDDGEYLEGDKDSLEEELKGEKLLVDDRQEVNEDPKVMEAGTVHNTVEDDCIVTEGAYNVVFGDVEDVETTKPVTSESASNVVCGDAKDAETNKPITSVSASNVVFGDVETTESVTSGTSSNVVFRDDKDVETNEQVTVIQIELEKLVEKGSKNDDPVGEMRHVVILSDGNDENNFNSQVVDVLDLVAREVIGDAKEDERSIESNEKVPRGSMGTQENNGGDAYNKDANEDAIMITMEEHLIHSNADAREIGEENLSDERNTSSNLEVGNEVKENAADDNGNEVKKNAADDDVDVLGRTPSKHDTDNAKVVYKKMPSREENLDDEKIWEKIAAMRTIVGYKAPTQPTCIGELKALYVFTGVEPPASFDGDSDLDAKLKFLMAIVGVK